MPVGWLALRNLDQVFLSQKICCAGRGRGSTDRCDLQMDQWNFKETEFSLLEVGGREFKASNPALDTDHQEAHDEQHDRGSDDDQDLDRSVTRFIRFRTDIGDSTTFGSGNRGGHGGSVGRCFAVRLWAALG